MAARPAKDFTTTPIRQIRQPISCSSPCLRGRTCSSSEFMTFENILREKKNSIAYITVNRPKVLNALNMATMEELRSAFHDIKNDPSIRVVIFTGSGEKAFNL